MTVLGLNHVTFAVTDLDRAFRFYVEVLGCRLLARWSCGAYLLAGEIWVALDVDPNARTSQHPDYTHIACSVTAEEFEAAARRIRDARAVC